ncbi:MAG: cyclopropane-fatty-acyl-phospholipid synthase [Paracoccaceae bacterium]|nr:cyclopropane-fatty-acyl-phospholipid synthase [Paracoccaceae bacterium]MDE2675058.1 cyclopropane-fatty-acyl-phospholipid synthase [Paracoccaceae bacterium]
MDIIVLNNDILVHGFPGSGLFRIRKRFVHLLNANSRKGSSRNIAYHYDLGNEFYRLWLDDTLTYSSALFKHEEETLSQAQNNKYAAICDRLELNRDDQVLEIGCGWGGFAEFAAKERGIKVTGLTISKEQQEHAKKRVFEAGLAERVSIHLRDYRDEQGTYDGIASIEMIEAVGEKYWPVYFKTLYDRLRPGGVAAIQAITISDSLFPNYRKGVDFMQKHIFPGGMLPSKNVMVKQGQSANLKPVYLHNFGGCYSKTLRLWRSQFNKRWNEISKLGFDKRFKRMWNYYLAASAAGFRANSIDVIQVGYKKL